MKIAIGSAWNGEQGVGIAVVSLPGLDLKWACIA